MSPEQEPSLAPPVGEWITPRPTRAFEVLQRLVGLPRLVRGQRDLVLTTLKRDLSARFQGTLLGWAWPFLQPLFLFAVYFFIFTELLQFRMPDLPEDQKAGMGVYMFCGMIAWGAFAETLARGTSVIVDNGNLIKKLAFPSELLPLNAVLAALVMSLFAVSSFLAAACLTPVWPAPGPALLWLPVILFLQALFTYGFLLFLSTLHVFLRDTAQVVAMVITVWMFLTPVFWVPELLGDKVERYLPLIHANPAYHLVSAWRGALMGDVVIPQGDELHRVLLHPVSVAAIPGHVGVFALWALGAYCIGYAFFVNSQRRFADEV